MQEISVPILAQKFEITLRKGVQSRETFSKDVRGTGFLGCLNVQGKQ
jgi:hypothetical protein